MNKLLNKITEGYLEGSAANTNATLKRTNTTAFIKDLEIECSIGIYEHEKGIPQTIRVNIEADTSIEDFDNVITVNDTVNYERFITSAKEIANQEHINLVEQFADELAAKCFEDPRIERLYITIEKPQATQEADSVGFTGEFYRG